MACQTRVRAIISNTSEFRIVHASLHPRLPLVVAVVAGHSEENDVPVSLQLLDIQLLQVTSPDYWETGLLELRCLARLGTFPCRWAWKRGADEWNIHVSEEEIILEQLKHASRNICTSTRRFYTNHSLETPYGIAKFQPQEIECGDIRFSFRMARNLPSGRMSFVFRQNDDRACPWTLVRPGKNEAIRTLLAVPPEVIGFGTLAVDDVHGVFIFARKMKTMVMYC
ncbi:hypothetical protein B0H11DRAFT_2082087 [Mycena galericulata]|nr:hypothetical protein B0H11DRAFT_2082087 [Mycena galericulata]